MKYYLSILAFAICISGCNVTVNENPANTASNANSKAPASSTTSSSETTAANATAAKPHTETNTQHSSADTKIAAGPDESKSVNVHFAAGKSEGTYSGSFAGYGYVDYNFSAKGGQELTTSIVRSDSNHAILGVMKNGEMIAPGSTEVQDWHGPIPADGSYTIRVGQMRNTARQSNKPVNYTLRIRIND